MLLLLSSLPAEWCYRLAMSGRQARSPGEPLPLYGLPLDVECLRITGGSQHSVQTSREPKSGRMVTSESAEAGVVHYRGAGRLDVLTLDPVVSHRGQPGDYVHTDGTVWTWLWRWRLVAGVHLRVYDLME